MKVLTITTILLINSSILFSYLLVQLSSTKVHEIEISTDKIKSNSEIKIIQITDFHNNKLINISNLISKIKKINPDIIVLTGDLINRDVHYNRDTYLLLKELEAVDKPVYFVTGNHEELNPRLEDLYELLEELDFTDLNFKSQTIKIKNEYIDIYGIPFFFKDEEVKFLENIPTTNYSILLSHSHIKAIDLKNVKPDLILSGHTHGGQIRLPFISKILSIKEPILYKKNLMGVYTKGLYKIEDRNIYVDSGLGSKTGTLRFFNRTQISYIKIKKS